MKGFYIGGLGEKSNEPGPMPNEAGSGHFRTAQLRLQAPLLTTRATHITLTQLS